jgi:hypothetical protein
MAVGILRRITTTLWGVPPLLLPEIVAHLGPFGALSWFAKMLPPYEKTLKDWGSVRTHLLCVEASLLNGCSYCIHAHAYAFQLYYFKEKHQLFPLDEHALVALRDGSDEEARAAVKSALSASQMPEDEALFDRLWQLKFDPTLDGVTDTDRRIRHILRMFEMLNFCGVDSQMPFDHAHDPINKDTELKERYARARLAQR